ncbi:MAG: ribose-phosphate diphosphokinase [Candidatus Bathyarchaeia archaeon]
MRIVRGPSSPRLASKISSSLGVPIVKAISKRFPDGEFYFKYDEDISGEDLLIVQSLAPPQDAHLLELLIMIYGAQDLGARSIKLFIPYLAYSRQDEMYLKGESVSSMMVTRLFENLGVNGLYTIDIHNSKLLEKYSIPTQNLTAAGELAKYFLAKNLRDPFIIAPDDEEMALKRAEDAAHVINAEYDYLGKERDRYSGEIETFSKDLNVKGRDVVIIDDIIATGKTTAYAARILRKQGARKIFAGVSHLLLLGNSLELLYGAGVEEVVGTDSVESRFSMVSVASIIAKTLKDEEDC